MLCDGGDIRKKLRTGGTYVPTLTITKNDAQNFIVCLLGAVRRLKESDLINVAERRLNVVKVGQLTSNNN